MIFNSAVSDRANVLRKQIQSDPSMPTIDDGESVSLLLWWTFILDHAQVHGLDPAWLAREQLKAFIEDAAPFLERKQEH